MKKYRNYIFDLYGTLVDLETDERKTPLWRLLSDFYRVYGCRWKVKELRDTFFAMDREEREILSARTGYACPEIKLERVFVRVLFDGKSHVPCDIRIAEETVDHWRELYEEDREAVLERLCNSDWAVAVSNMFRVYSRRYICLYPRVIETLERLKQEGCGVYLLSNAQKIFTMPEIEMLGLDTCFDRMYISSDYECMKPQKDFMQLLLQQEGLDPKESVMVGNEPASDVAIALRCGMDSILLNTAGEPEEEIKKKITTLKRKEGNPGRNRVWIISSGDISEIR